MVRKSGCSHPDFYMLDVICTYAFCFDGITGRPVTCWLENIEALINPFCLTCILFRCCVMNVAVVRSQDPGWVDADA